jgi:hypothetical protein
MLVVAVDSVNKGAKTVEVGCTYSKDLITLSVIIFDNISFEWSSQILVALLDRLNIAEGSIGIRALIESESIKRR